MPILFSNFNLTEGLNLGVSQHLNRSGEAREALNCDFSIPGELARQLGYATYGTGLAASNVLGIYDFKKTDGTYKWLAGAGTRIYYDNNGTWTQALTGLTTGLDMSFATHLDIVVMANGTDTVKKSSDGISWSALGGSPPVGKYALTFNNSIYLLNLTGATSRIQWSDDGTTETWTGTNVQDVTTNVGIGDQITGGAVNNNVLLVFKNYTVWKWNTYELVCIDSSAGCRAPKSIAKIDEWTFWLSHKGIMATNGGKPFRVSKAVEPFIDAISDITTPVGWSEDNFYYLYIGTVDVTGIGSIANCVLIYDFDNNVWSYKSLGDAVKSAAILTDSDNARFAYIGNDAGQVYKFKTGNNDNAAAIPFKFVGAPQMSGAPQSQKDYKLLQVYLDRTAKYGIDVFYSVDFKDFKPLGTATDTVSEFQFPSGTKGYNIRIAYQTNMTSDQQKILGHVCQGDIVPGRLLGVK